MAALSITINEGINLFGAEPSNKWGTVLWGEKWGFGNVGIVQEIYQNLDDAVVANVIVMTDTVSTLFRIVLTIEDSITMIGDLNNVNLIDAVGYRYIYTTPTDDSEDAPATNWTASSVPTTVFSNVSQSSTPWSDA